ncbi:MAG: hypothetical protein HYW88_01450 [Candidatus Sungbacteria bacterium]|nr:hypothetical protein [Candidatus Sungbacteria bacterium]
MAHVQIISNSERTKAIKKILGELYGLRNVGVCTGRGTAHSWVYIKVRVKKQTTDTTLEKRNRRELKIQEEVEKAIVDSGVKLSQYYTDYGPKNRHNNCLRVEIEFT